MTRVPYVFFLSPTDLDSKPVEREGGAGMEVVTLSAKAQHMRPWQSWPSWASLSSPSSLPVKHEGHTEHALWPSRTTWRGECGFEITRAYPTCTKHTHAFRVVRAYSIHRTPFNKSMIAPLDRTRIVTIAMVSCAILSHDLTFMSPFKSVWAQTFRICETPKRVMILKTVSPRSVRFGVGAYTHNSIHIWLDCHLSNS